MGMAKAMAMAKTKGKATAKVMAKATAKTITFKTGDSVFSMANLRRPHESVLE